MNQVAAITILFPMLTRVTGYHSPACVEKEDIIFLLDGSDSLSYPEFEDAKNVISTFVQEKLSNESNIRIGAIVVSSAIGDIVMLSNSKETILKNVSRLGQPQEGSRIDLGINRMKKMLDEDGRRDVAQFGIIFTDGRFKYRNEAIKNSSLLKDSGVTIITIGIGRLIDEDVLRLIASDSKKFLNGGEINKTVDAVKDIISRNALEGCIEVSPEHGLKAKTKIPGVYMVLNQMIEKNELQRKKISSLNKSRSAEVELTGPGYSISVKNDHIEKMNFPPITAKSVHKEGNLMKSSVHLKNWYDLDRKFQNNAAGQELGFQYRTPSRWQRKTVLADWSNFSRSNKAHGKDVRLIDHILNNNSKSFVIPLQNTNSELKINSKSSKKKPSKMQQQSASYGVFVDKLMTVPPVISDLSHNKTNHNSSVSGSGGKLDIPLLMQHSNATQSSILRKNKRLLPIIISPAALTTDKTVTTLIRDENKYLTRHCYESPFILGVGYQLDPKTCHHFIQCFYDNGRMRIDKAICPFRMFWDQSSLVCRPSSLVKCKRDPCLQTSVKSYGHEGNCRAYWVCANGTSTARCCGIGYRFHEERGCVKDSKCVDICQDQGPIKFKKPYDTCRMIPFDTNDRYYYEDIPGLGVMVRPCPQGSEFNATLCSCVMRHSYPREYCLPEVILDFDNTFNDKSGKSVAITPFNVKIQNGSAKFDGNGKITLWRFSSFSFKSKLIITMKFKENQNSSTRGIQHLISNCCCKDRPGPSVDISIIPGSGARFTAATQSFGRRAVVVPYRNRDWKTATFIYDGNKLSGRIGSARSSITQKGDIAERPSSLVIGSCDNTGGFEGLIDDVRLYLCIPKNA